MSDDKNRPQATPEQIDAARAVYHVEGEIEIDDDAKVSEAEGCHWVQAWVYMEVSV